MEARDLERVLYKVLSQALSEMVDNFTGTQYYNIDRFIGVCIGDNNVRTTGAYCRTKGLAISTIPLPNNGKVAGYYNCVERVRYKCFKSDRDDVLKSNPGKDPDEIILAREFHISRLTEISIVFSKEYFDDDYLPF